MKKWLGCLDVWTDFMKDVKMLLHVVAMFLKSLPLALRWQYSGQRIHLHQLNYISCIVCLWCETCV